MIRLVSFFQSLQRREEGASLVEYALLLALIAVVAIVAIQALGTNSRDKLQTVSDAVGGS